MFTLSRSKGIGQNPLMVRLAHYDRAVQPQSTLAANDLPVIALPNPTRSLREGTNHILTFSIEGDW